MTDVPGPARLADTVRSVHDPASVPCFRRVTEIRHFPSGDVLLERDQRRDCLLSGVDRVDVPATDAHREGDTAVLETDTTVAVVDEGDTCTLGELRLDATLG